jgi:hypothetical protein
LTGRWKIYKIIFISNKFARLSYAIIWIKLAGWYVKWKKSDPE